MIKGNDIAKLVQLLKRRNVSFFHACQFLDFQSYLQLGGIPSHAELERTALGYTPFETDYNDQMNGVWDKVFVNFSDFGKNFASGGKCVPNPYGPILIQVKPSILLEASDVAISLKSGGAANFDREREALKTLGDVDKLFRYETGSAIAYRDILSERFGYPGAADPEISCTVATGKLSLQHCEKVIIDPYIIGEKSLLEYVRQKMALQAFAMDLPVYERRCSCQARMPLYNELLAVVKCLPFTLKGLSSHQSVKDALSCWARSVETNPGLEMQYRRFAKYLHFGTIRYTDKLTKGI